MAEDVLNVVLVEDVVHLVLAEVVVYLEVVQDVVHLKRLGMWLILYWLKKWFN